MPITRRTLIAAAAGVGFMQSAPRLGRAQAANTIRIGVLNDQSGLYSHIGGVNGVAMAQAAAGEFNARGFTVEVLRADHQNRPDVGSNIARQWLDRDGVDMILDVPTSSVGLAVAGVAREKNKAYVNVGAASSDLTPAGRRAATPGARAAPGRPTARAPPSASPAAAPTAPGSPTGRRRTGARSPPASPASRRRARRRR